MKKKIIKGFLLISIFMTCVANMFYGENIKNGKAIERVIIENGSMEKVSVMFNNAGKEPLKIDLDPHTRKLFDGRGYLTEGVNSSFDVMYFDSRHGNYTRKGETRKGEIKWSSEKTIAPFSGIEYDSDKREMKITLGK